MNIAKENKQPTLGKNAIALFWILPILSAFVSCASLPVGDPKDPVNNPEKVVSLMYEFTLTPQDRDTKYVLRVLLPQDYVGRQRVIEEVYSVEPTDVVDDGTNRYAVFVQDGSGDRQRISIRIDVGIRRFDFETAQSPGEDAGLMNSTALAAYLSDEKFLETKNPLLVRQAQRLAASDELTTIKNVLRFVRTHLRYDVYNPNDIGALAAYRARRGDCTEFTDLFVTLCRINKIPARFVEGYLGQGNEAQHDWAEVYMTDIGWVPVDPTAFSLSKVPYFGKLSNSYLYLSKKRIDETIDNYHYWAYRYFGKPIAVESTTRIEYRKTKT